MMIKIFAKCMAVLTAAASFIAAAAGLTAYAEQSAEKPDDFFEPLYLYQSVVTAFPESNTDYTVTVSDVDFDSATVGTDCEGDYTFKIGLFRKVETALGVVEYQFEALAEIDYNYDVLFIELVPNADYVAQVCAYSEGEIALVFESVHFQTKEYDEASDGYALPDEAPDSGGLHPAAIAGICAGAVVLLAALAAVFLVWKRRKKKQ